MSVNENRKVGVVGVGAIGSGVAQLLATRGIDTIIVAPRPGGVERARAMMQRCFDGDVERGRLDAADAAQGFSRLRFSASYADLKGAQFVIESVPENLELKRQVLAQVEANSGEDCIFGTNTSSIPIRRIAAGSRRPQQVIGLHFFWPAHRFKLVEIPRAAATSQDTVDSALRFLRSLGKTPLLVKDGPAFYTTRILLPYVSEALELVMQGATISDVDSAMREFGWAMGPFRLIDATGVETVARVHDMVSSELGVRIAALRRLQDIVEAGHVGYRGGSRRDAKGFYRYPEGVEVDDRVHAILGRAGTRAASREEIARRPVYQMINEVGHCLDEQVVGSFEDADLGAVLGIGWPADKSGPIAFARQHGPAEIVTALEGWASTYGPRFTPSRTLRELASQPPSMPADTYIEVGEKEN